MTNCGFAADVFNASGGHRSRGSLLAGQTAAVPLCKVRLLCCVPGAKSQAQLMRELQ
jgi:hypothetical protein